MGIAPGHIFIDVDRCCAFPLMFDRWRTLTKTYLLGDLVYTYFCHTVLPYLVTFIGL